jgi:YYY domain-containing protein
MTLETTPETRSNAKRGWIFDLLLVFILLAATYLRVSGLYWGEYQYLHPDERFLVWVGSDITPVTCLDPNYAIQNCPPDQVHWISLGEYFDSANSTLNPANRGHAFYVYGTLPMFMARYIVQWIYGHSGFMEMTQVGRALSAGADILAVLLVYLVAERLYDRRVGLLAAAFSAAVVLQIQQAHFFTMDTFINLFTLLSFYFAVRIMLSPQPQKVTVNEPAAEPEAGWQMARDRLAGDQLNAIQRAVPSPDKANFLRKFLKQPLFLYSLAFGVAFGMAVASKLNAAPMALVLPAAMGIYLLKLDPQERQEQITAALGYLALAGAVSLLVFRIFQPYAFSGPSFLDVKLNPQWLSSIRELQAQNTVEVDFPPAMQWARRSFWFSGKNMVLWGLGIPLGILAWSGFLWAGWRILAGLRNSGWRRHALIWGWTGFYFVWQSSALNPTMRYQLPIYPMLVIFAAWGLVALWDKGKAQIGAHRLSNRWRILAVGLGGVALLATFAYAFAFSRIYTHPITRIEASRWIYQNVPGPINLHIQTDQGTLNQPLPYPYDRGISPGNAYQTVFTPNASGILDEIYLPHLQDLQGTPEVENIQLVVSAQPNGLDPLANSSLNADLSASASENGSSYNFKLDHPLTVEENQSYYLSLSVAGKQPALLLSGQPALRVVSGDGRIQDQFLPAMAQEISYAAPYTTNFTANLSGSLHEIFMPAEEASAENNQPETLSLILGTPGSDQPMDNTTVPVQVTPESTGYRLTLNQPIQISNGQNYFLGLSLPAESGTITLAGSGVTNETDWDDGLPLRIDGYDAMGGLYPHDMVLQMYWDDNPEKYDRFVSILDRTDYIVISSSRQWGSLPRLPERFPMTTLYYRDLIGCPPEQTIEWCYNVAKPGMFNGNLGFDLVKTFQSNPQIGSLQINDQFAEEAFTVYDHPKVFIFQKTGQYDPQKVRAILGSVDFSQVIRIAPLKAGPHPANLMLPSERLAEQRQGGTWSNLFNTQALQNRYPLLSVLVWYLSVFLLGIFIYPLLRMAFSSLPDRGYPLARITGLLVLSYIVWLAGSFEIPVTRLTISIVIAILAALGGWLAFRQRDELRLELDQHWRYFLVVEGLFLAFFAFDLLIRLGNPDLWHPWKGGEKPMDFAYFNAVLKSTTFPPYDPWFAGGYLNYYYYGFVLVGVLVKWLGIVPAVAYNLILPTVFSLIAMGAFSLVWNLVSRWVQSRRVEEGAGGLRYPRYWTAIGGALGMAVLGNLGTVRMIFQGYQRLAAPNGVIEGAGLLTKYVWALRGFVMALAGKPLPYGIGDWYWIPSRAIPAPGEIEPITEFPFFTVLYGDPHAHLFALPIALLALTFALAIIFQKAHWKSLGSFGASFLIGALAIGALRPTNTWDFYTYLALGSMAILYTILVYYRPSQRMLRALPFLSTLPEFSLKLLAAGGGVLLLAGLAHVLYQPYIEWYGLGYGKVDLWYGTHTPVSAYFTHWGLFLFVIISWLAWETRDWMARTPASSLRKLGPYRNLIQAALVVLALLVLVLLVFFQVNIAWVALPLAAWAGILILRPGQGDAKRFVLFLIGTGLVLTLVVEVFVLRGDIARMNTVFKFYLQVWTLFAVSAGAGLGWLLVSLPEWSPRWRGVWQVGLALLVAGAALYPLMGGLAKIKDRMAEDAPHTLNGMTYMQYAQYPQDDVMMDLSHDYQAIRWMQENVSGSPVIVEANIRDLYRWGSRYSIYTGLPGVVGWEWHEQQQRAVVPGSWVSNRIVEIDSFYQTIDIDQARAFLQKYDVQYIVLGQQERTHYPGPGLDKFEAFNGVYWRVVYRQADTVIYQVIQ